MILFIMIDDPQPEFLPRASMHSVDDGPKILGVFMSAHHIISFQFLSNYEVRAIVSISYSLIYNRGGN